MSNSIRTPKQGVTVNSRRIAQAVDNEGWQRFRMSMKGKSTQEKLDMLRDYYNRAVDADLSVHMENVRIRVDNYIKALCRGGLLYGGESLESCVSANWHVKIKRM